MTNEEQLLIAIKADTTNLMSGLKTASTGISNFSKNIAGIGKGMTIAGAAITAGFAMAIKTASGFEQSMANVASVASATKEELQALTDTARKQGEESVYSASQAADAMYYLASAGMTVKEIIGALAGTMDLAASTQSDLAFTSEAVAATLSQYNLEAEEAGRISNVFAAGVSKSQATMEKLKTSLSYVGPVAKSLGMSLEDTVGILTNLYNAGYDGSKAGTALRMAFSQLLDPTKDATDTMEKLGININDATGVMRPFKDIINDLGEVGMSAGDAMDIFGKRAGPAMLALVSQGQGAIEKMTEAVTGTNMATEMAAMQIDTFQGSMKLLKSAFEEFQITLVQDLMPALRPFIEQITEIIKQVSNWIKANPELAASVTKIAAAIGAICVVGGPILMAIGAFGGLAGAIGLIISPIGLVIAAVAGLAIAWKTNFLGIRDITKSVIDFVKSVFDKLVKFIIASFERLKKVIDFIKKAVAGIGKIAVEGITVGPETKESFGIGGTSVPSHAEGISYVPKTGLALIHEGEGVLNKAENKAYQAGAKSYTININNPVVRNDDDISRMREQFEESIKKLIPEFNRSGNYSVPGMA